MEHQNWDTIVLRAKKNKETPTDKTQLEQSKSNFNTHEKNLDKNIENGTMRMKKVEKESSLSIQQQRAQKGLTQKDLANKLNIPVKILNEIESGKGKHNPQIMNRLNRILK